MARPKGKKILDKLFNEIINDISLNGMSAKSALKDKMSSSTFHEILNNDSEKSKRYARACEMRADLIAEETLDIADDSSGDLTTLSDGRKVENNHVINRDRLRVDTRKWLLSKLHPKKYGDRIDMTSNGKDLNTCIQIEIINKSEQVIDNEDTSSR